MRSHAPYFDRLSVKPLPVPFPGAVGSVRRAVFDADTPENRAALWADVQQQSHDRRFLNGEAAFRSAKKPRKQRTYTRARAARVANDQGFANRQAAIDALLEIPAEVYLPALAGVEPLPGGRCLCPWPDHDDHNPSASFKGTEFYCHTCAEGGGLIRLAASFVGVGTTGSDFLTAAQWAAERLINAAIEWPDDERGRLR